MGLRVLVIFFTTALIFVGVAYETPLTSVRTPQSIKPAVQTLATEPLKLSCHAESISTSSHRVRFNLKPCSTKAKEVSLVNQTNGYLATVFKNQNHSLSTDFITLEKGENTITVSFNDPDGAVKTLKVLVQRN